MTASRQLFPAFSLLSFLVALPLHAQPDRITGRAFATRSPVLGQHGMACTSQPLVTQIALDVLKAGGSAVDAAIAADAALGVMEPTGSGMGGDLFAIVWDAKTEKLYGLNGSGRSPRGLDYAGMQAELAKIGRSTLPNRGFLPITVPGCVDAWFELHAKFGRLPMRELLAPAARYADEGFPVTQYISLLWNNEVRHAQAEHLPGAFLEVFAPGGHAPQEGEIFRNPDLARTLRLVGEKGRDAFYRGEVAAQVDAFMRAQGGFLRKVDFEQHTSTWVEPVSVNYRGYDVFELPPSTQGIAALQMLNILEGYDLAKLGRNSPEALHLMIEAK
jgi:gamma-glutamyltranspeptidase/glutathione hydrolase